MGSMDLTNPQSLNRYAYALNSPVNVVDPLGLCGETWNPSTNTENWDDTNCVSSDYYWLMFFANSFFLGYGGSSTGGSVPTQDPVKATPDVNKTWSKTFSCNKNAKQVMSAVQQNMGQFADNRSTLFSANFPHRPIEMGGEYVIQPGLNSHDGYQLPAANLVVTVTSQSANGWTFTTDPSRHFFNGTVSFSSSDAGGGNITFSVMVNANWVSPFTHYTVGPVVLAGENSTWKNMLNNVEGYCQSPIGN